MRKNKYIKGNPQLRKMLIREAARLMYEDGVGQYHDAKHLAVKRILNQGKKGSTPLRTRDLPSNGEISDELSVLAQFYEGNTLTNRLFSMRVTALEVMSALEQFTPRLIGSVSTGKIRKGSDIDLHVFTDSVATLLWHLSELGWHYETSVITIRKGNAFCDYTHVYFDREFPVELSVYPRMELRVRGRSSTDGKPIVRLSSDSLLQILLNEHGEAWGNYIQSQLEADSHQAASTN
jgi:hypothetical protein